MRRKKQKHTRRAIRFYKINYGFRSPYKVLLDGNFVHAVGSLKRGDCKEEITKLLGEPARVFTTKCVMHELRKLGGDFATARQQSKRYALHHCGHDSAVSATECLAAQVEAGNPEHFFIATQDRALQRKVNAMPGGAVLFASVNGLHIESPSEPQKQHALSKDTGLAHEIAGVKRQLEAKDGSEVDGDEDEEGQRHRRSQQQGHDRAVFRRVKAKGPNPLSMKKKKKKGVVVAIPGGESRKEAAEGGGEEGPVQQKARRQRRKKLAADGDGDPE